MPLPAAAAAARQLPAGTQWSANPLCPSRLAADLARSLPPTTTGIAPHLCALLQPSLVCLLLHAEPLTLKMPQGLLGRLRKARAIWDYSLENVKVLKSLGVSAVHVPLGYARSMDGPAAAAQNSSSASESSTASDGKSVDVVFVGSTRPRRTAILQQLERDLGPSVTLSTRQRWGAHLLQLYRGARVGLNIHGSEGMPLEIHRIIPMLAHRLWVVSEPSADSTLDRQFAGVVDFVDAEGLAAHCLAVLQRPDFAAEVEARHHRLLACCRFADALRPAVEALAHATSQQPSSAQ